MAKSCCRSSPRCADCPVVLAAVARRRRHEREDLVATLVDEIFSGAGRRPLPEPVARTLEQLERTRRGRLPVGAA